MWNGNEKEQCNLRFGLDILKRLQLSTNGSGDYSSLSPYCVLKFPWNVLYRADTLFDGNSHYWIWSIDCSKTYNSSDTSELAGYEGYFYSSKIFVDGELLYDTYYSKEQYDYLKNNQDTLNLKYFTLGRCSMVKDGWWHYSKMKIYCMRLYNRSLSNEEMLENYNTTKTYYSAIIEN